MRQRIHDRYIWLTTTWEGTRAAIYWAVALIMSSGFSYSAGRLAVEWIDYNFFTSPAWWGYVLIYGTFFALPFMLFGLLWTVINLKNLGSGVADADVEIIVQPRLSLRFLRYIFTPIRILLGIPYRGVKGFRDWILRTAVLIIGCYMVLTFVSMSPPTREGLANLWALAWPILLVAFVAYGLWEFFVMHRGTGVLVKKDGTIMVVQMKFWYVFLAPLVVEVDASKIDVKSFRSVIIPFFPQIALWSGFSLVHESGDAVTVRGLSLADVKDRVANASANGRRIATAEAGVLNELAKKEAAARIAAANPQPTPTP